MNDELDINELVRKAIKEARKNKIKCQQNQSGQGYQILRTGQVYPSIIINAEKKEEKLKLDFDIFKNWSSVAKKAVQFKTDGSNSFYDEICETLGTDGDPADLIGKYAAIHIERNGNFQNLKVDVEIDKGEFREMLDNLGGNKSKKKKKPGRKKPTPTKAAGKATVRKAKKKPADFDEYEDMDSDSDYEEAYDGDDYGGEYDDRNAEQDYLDDMADFQG